MASSDSISTSPLAMQAYNVIKHLDKLIGPAAAQSWMLSSNELLGGTTPVGAIKERRLEDVIKAMHVVAMEKGIFEEPFLPPGAEK
ncbi:hypothetical protein ACQR1W_31380 [Bradyrhizobium sp. HKCCYLS1011]|uniref:hypothetical protein n=1 Tax=Bradyrhizobium sp. HKCCYLS1011 TaxID=3420733 RepID=UPI003EBC5A05